MPVTFRRRITVLASLVAGLWGPAATAAPLAADFSNASYFLSGDLNNIGWSFSVTSSVTIDALGLFDFASDGLVNSHQVGLWDSTNTLIAQTTVFNAAAALPSASGAGQWLFVDIAALTLEVGDYVIGAFYDDFDADPIAAITDDLMLDSHFSYNASRASDSTTFGMPGVYGLAEPGIFGPNMRVAAPTPVPEPGMLALLGLAMTAGATATARRRRG